MAIRLCGSLSRHASPLGAAMHNAAYRALDLDWHYVPFEIDELGPALTAMRTLGIRGLGISMPFKLEILPLLDVVEPTAKRIGAVNTVVNDDGRLVGHNTDWVGATRALQEVVALAGTSVLLLGAGGAARAVGFGLREAGAAIHLTNRNDERGRALANDVDATFVPWRARAEVNTTVVVNATSAGMADVDPTSPLPADCLGGRVVMDIVYKPLRTALVKQAAARGATCIHGGRMLLHQAARQHELYTGLDAPLAAMDRAITDLSGAGEDG